jgi:hypothetical protein
VAVDNAAKSAQLRTLNLVGNQNSQPFLRTELTSPMTISFGGASASAGDAALNISLINLNLADWRAFVAEMSPEGVMNASLKLNSQQGGKLLNFDLNGRIAGLSAKLGDKVIQRSDITIRARGDGTDLKQLKLAEFATELAQGGQSAATLTGSGTFNVETKAADLQVALQVTLTKLLAMFPQPDARFSSGNLELNGHVTSKEKAQTLSGKLTLAGLTGNYGTYSFSDFATTADVDVAANDTKIEIRKAAGELRQAANSGGKFEATGIFDTAQKAGKLVLKLVDFNQHGLRPFLEPSLGEKKLVSVTLNTTANADFQSNGDATVKAELQVANLIVNDPSGTVPATPLEAKAKLDAGVSKSVAQIRECRLGLTPTEKAKANDLNLSGTVDFSKTNAINGNLKLAAETLDLTRYYELFAGKKNEAQPNPAGKQPSSPTSAPAAKPTSDEKEPEAMNLPIGRFTADVNVKQFYLSEVIITNLQTTATIEGSHLVLKPCQLALNGGPVTATADVNLGMPGYRYDVSFTAQSVPLAPLVNTFQPESKGQVGGQLVANAQIKGAGITGANLQKNLTSQFDIDSTNLNLSVLNIKSKLLKTVINVIAAVPEILKNPTAAGGSLAGALFGGTETRQGGLYDELSKAPINVISAHGNVGAGKVNLQRALIESSAFQAEADGVIAIAEVLTNSTLNVPLHIALQRSLADRVNLAGDTPTNAVYAKLPDYVTVKGTLGKPEPKYNALALVGTAAKTLGNIGNIPGVNTNTGALIQGLGDLLTKPRSQSTNSPPNANQPTTTTNQPTTSNPQPNAVEVIRGFGELFKKPKNTNPPANPK